MFSSYIVLWRLHVAGPGKSVVHIDPLALESTIQPNKPLLTAPPLLPHLTAGLFWLFMGVANSDAKLYDDEISAMTATYPDQFRIDYALSREQNNVKGGKMYIQVRAGDSRGQPLRGHLHAGCAPLHMPTPCHQFSVKIESKCCWPVWTRRCASGAGAHDKAASAEPPPSAAPPLPPRRTRLRSTPTRCSAC